MSNRLGFVLREKHETVGERKIRAYCEVFSSLILSKLTRATMAEEQLKQLQEHLNKTTQEYTKKIHELKKQVIFRNDCLRNV